MRQVVSKPQFLSSSVERYIDIVEVSGSTPLGTTSLRIVTATLKQQYSVKVRERFDSVAARFGVTVALV